MCVLYYLMRQGRDLGEANVSTDLNIFSFKICTESLHVASDDCAPSAQGIRLALTSSVSLYPQFRNIRYVQALLAFVKLLEETAWDLEKLFYFSPSGPVVSASCDLTDCSLPGSSAHGIFLARILEWVAISSSGDISDPGIEPASPVSPALAGRFFTTEPPGNHFLMSVCPK